MAQDFQHDNVVIQWSKGQRLLFDKLIIPRNYVADDDNSTQIDTFVKKIFNNNDVFGINVFTQNYIPIFIDLSQNKTSLFYNDQIIKIQELSMLQ